MIININKKPRSEPLKYLLVRSSRKSIGISVHPDGSVVVRAPLRATDAQIKEVVTKKLDWIVKHQHNFKNLGPAYSKREFVDGEKHLLLGEEYVLRVKTAVENRVEKKGDTIVVECRDEAFVEPLMESWYKAKANELIPGIVEPIVDSFKETYKVSPQKITLRTMKSRWGSCSSKRNISINTRLIKSHPKCIEFVMAHELCHLIELNHSKDYYNLLVEFMPDWKERKRMLNHYMR